jgi:hypothetical protein
VCFLGSKVYRFNVENLAPNLKYVLNEVVFEDAIFIVTYKNLPRIQKLISPKHPNAVLCSFLLSQTAPELVPIIVMPKEPKAAVVAIDTCGTCRQRQSD